MEIGILSIDDDLMLSYESLNLSFSTLQVMK